MAFRAFTATHVYEKRVAPKEKGKSSIQCLECHGRNLYIGTKDATVQHLVLPSGTDGDSGPDQSKTREGRTRKLGSSNPVSKLRAVPLFSRLLALWDRSVSALDMFSLEPVPALKRLRHVSLFEVGDSGLDGGGGVQMVTASSRRRVIQIHVVTADRWAVAREVALPQDPVALAVDGEVVCVATGDRYLLCDTATGSSEELFPHSHARQRVVVASVGQGEFLLNGPGSLGVFVMKTGTSQRPPLQWPEGVLAAGACFPYVLALRAQELSVYSVLDQQRKQTVALSGARGLLATPDGALVFTESDVVRLRPVPLPEQIQALVRHERVEEALLLLEGVRRRRPLDSHEELQKAVACLAGFVRFRQQGFFEARDLFIQGELDPREIIGLYPDMRSCLGEDFRSQHDQVDKGRDLRALWQQDRAAYHRHLSFLGDFLRAVRGTRQGLACVREVDCALLRLYVELGDADGLQQLVAFPNDCDLELCAPVLEGHSRYFALGSLFQSQGHHIDAIQTWVKIADGVHKDPSCSDPYGHIVSTLSQLRDGDVVRKFAEWTLERNQEIGVQIFSRRPPDDREKTQENLTLLEKYPRALLLHLEFLVHDLSSEEEGHHNRLALAYVTKSLREEEEADSRETRRKLQQHLWESKFYDVAAVFDMVKATNLHTERAILLVRMGEHSQALQELVRHDRTPGAAEAFCRKVARGQGPQFKRTLLLGLVRVYLDSGALASAAVDLLNNGPRDFPAQKVLWLLPDSWSVQLVSRFLTGSLRETSHQRRMARLRTALSQVELMRQKVIWMQASKTKFTLAEGQKCGVCRGDLAEPHFARNLHGDPVHTGCSGLPSP